MVSVVCTPWNQSVSLLRDQMEVHSGGWTKGVVRARRDVTDVAVREAVVEGAMEVIDMTATATAET